MAQPSALFVGYRIDCKIPLFQRNPAAKKRGKTGALFNGKPLAPHLLGAGQEDLHIIIGCQQGMVRVTVLDDCQGGVWEGDRKG